MKAPTQVTALRQATALNDSERLAALPRLVQLEKELAAEIKRLSCGGQRSSPPIHRPLPAQGVQTRPPEPIA